MHSLEDFAAHSKEHGTDVHIVQLLPDVTRLSIPGKSQWYHAFSGFTALQCAMKLAALGASIQLNGKK
jgi:hypothetical protein